MGIISTLFGGSKAADKAMDLAKVELSKFARGGNTKKFMDGIDWIITGKYIK